MKTIKFLSILFILLGFSQCGGSILVKKSILKVEKAFYNNWFGGQPGVRGTKVEIHLKDASEVIFVAFNSSKHWQKHLPNSALASKKWFN